MPRPIKQPWRLCAQKERLHHAAAVAPSPESSSSSARIQIFERQVRSESCLSERPALVSRNRQLSWDYRRPNHPRHRRTQKGSSQLNSRLRKMRNVTCVILARFAISMLPSVRANGFLGSYTGREINASQLLQESRAAHKIVPKRLRIHQRRESLSSAFLRYALLR